VAIAQREFIAGEKGLAPVGPAIVANDISALEIVGGVESAPGLC